MNLVQNEKSGVNSQLRLLTNAYLDKHPGLTLNSLSSRCGVPATTMRRLMKGSATTDTSELAPHAVLSLVSYLLKEKKISALLKKTDGAIAELLNRCFDQFIFSEEKSSHQLDNDLNTLLRDKTTYLIYKLAANRCGTSIDDIKNIFGLTGLKKLFDLIEKNWLVSDTQNSEIFHAKEKDFSLDLALAHELSHSLVDYYKPQDIEAGFNLFYSLSEGMNKSGILKIKEIEKEAIKKIFETMNDKQYLGPIPYYALIISDILGITPTTSLKGVHQ